MAQGLAKLEKPIAIRTDNIARHVTTIDVKQHGASWSKGDFTISKTSTDSPRAKTLFTVDGKALSLTHRHNFCDSSGLPLFELRREPFGVTRYVQLPGSNSPPLVTIAPKWRWVKERVDIYVHNAAEDGGDLVLEARGRDIWKNSTHVYFNGALVMWSKRKDIFSGPGVSGLGIGAEWEVDIAKGLDLSLASVIMVSLAHTVNDTMRHSFAEPSSGATAGPSDCTKSPSKN